MIKTIDSIIHIDTNDTSLILHITKTNHLTNLYYGSKLPVAESYDFLMENKQFPNGTEVAYSEDDVAFCLDDLALEFPVHGKGDYREPSLIIQSSTNQVLDLLYESHELLDELPQLDGLPTPHTPDEVLKITLIDKVGGLKVDLIYGIFEQSNVISRNAIIENIGKTAIIIDKAMSMNLDLPSGKYDLINTHGAWASEFHLSRQPLRPGIFTSDSKTGNSSNRHNPYFMIAEPKTDFETGVCFGFNLLYSGNHAETIEVSANKRLRIQTGINPFLFHYQVNPGEKFETPVAIMSYAPNGFNRLSNNFHNFINHHIIRGPWANKERPVLLNNWEATYFDFTEPKLLTLLNHAKQIGVELFVLDDGWFGKRDDDTKGLGDYDINTKKLPHGLANLADKANSKGLKFGLWFEPEMVNESSKLFQAHPDWAIRATKRVPSKGRHQLVLDLSRFEVQAYLLESISTVLDSAHIEYVKWDMNRHISDFQSDAYNQGELYHRYIKGLYHVLHVLTHKYDYILWEGCASGGNRFDLGMLCYFQQMWTSDDTDPIERLSIQSGASLAYPLSTIGAHVSASPAHQTLRKTPLETRFHVACFGNLGYELDLRKLAPIELKEIKEQITFYKAHRQLLQYGRFFQLKTIKSDGYALYMVQSEDRSEAIVGYFQLLQPMLPSFDKLKLTGFIDEVNYEIHIRSFGHRVKLFGGLINHVTPIPVNEEGALINFIDKRKTIEQLIKAEEKPLIMTSGAALNNGAITLPPKWSGTGFNEKVGLIGDFSSMMFYIKQIKTPD